MQRAQGAFLQRISSCDKLLRLKRISSFDKLLGLNAFPHCLTAVLQLARTQSLPPKALGPIPPAAQPPPIFYSPEA